MNYAARVVITQDLRNVDDDNKMVDSVINVSDLISEQKGLGDRRWSGALKHETLKAYLLDVKGEDVWVPKSHVKLEKIRESSLMDFCF